MVEILIDGKALVLPEGVTANMQLRPGFIDTDISEPFSLPFNFPRAGNEHIIGHLNRADLAEHVVEFERAEMRNSGVVVHKGKVTILDALPDSYSASFSDNGLASSANRTNLRDIDHGAPVPLPSGLRAHAADVNNTAWPEADYCFPMMHCPDLMPDNPQWNQTASEWDTDTAYEVGRRVLYASPATLMREQVYRCIAATSAGTAPTNTSYWEPYSSAILNRWDIDNNEFPANGPVTQWDPDTGIDDPAAPTLGHNFYAMAAMPYWKYVLKRVAAHWGLRCEGSFMDDPAFNRVVLYSNHLLDKEPWTDFWRAEQTQVISTAGSPNEAIVPLHDDSTNGNTDPGNQWDTGTMQWTCPAAGWFFFRISVGSRANIGTTPDKQYGLRVSLMKSGGPPTEVTYDLVQPYARGERHTVILFHEFDSGDVGSVYFFKVAVSDPAWTQPVALTNYVVQGTRANAASLVNTFADHIDRNHIVPDISIAEFLTATRDRFGVHIALDVLNGVLRVDNATTAMDAPPIDMTARVRGDMRLEYTGENRSGISFSERGDLEYADLSGYETGTFIAEEASIPAPTNPGHYVVVSSTRRVYTTKLLYGWSPVWVPLGHYRGEVETGPGPDRVTVLPAFSLPALEIVRYQDNAFLVPSASGKGNSAWWATNYSKTALLAFIYHGMTDNGNGALYPFASPYRCGPTGEDLNTLDLSWEDNNSPYARNWSRVERAFTNPVRVRVSVAIDHALLLQHFERRIWQIENQLYLPVNVPVVHRNGPLMAIDCELIRWTP